MKAFVIEYFDQSEPDRLERKQFWEGLRRRQTGQIEISLSKQERRGDFLVEADGNPFDIQEYDVLFIHSSDMQYSAGDSYIELAKVRGKAFVCYSGGTSAIDARALEECQIELMPLTKLRTNIELFFEDVARRGIVCPESFYLLAGIDPRLEAALDLLYFFLPLDIELQLKDGAKYVEKCKARACELREQGAEITRLIRKALGIEFDPNAANLAIEAVALADDGQGAVSLLKTLLSHSERICTEDIDELVLTKIFGSGQISDDELKDVDSEPENIGFHQTYKDFRDQLLASVGSNQGNGR